MVKKFLDSKITFIKNTKNIPGWLTYLIKV